MEPAGRAGNDLTAQGLRFMVVGSLATIVQLGLYAFLSGSAGAQLANVVAWLVSTMVGNAAHHRYTFQVAGGSTESDHLVGLLTSFAGLGVSSLALVALNQPTGISGTIALVAVNAAVGVLRFAVLRWWVGRVHRVPAGAPVTDRQPSPRPARMNFPRADQPAGFGAGVTQVAELSRAGA